MKQDIVLKVVPQRKEAYDFHAPLNEETDLEFVIGVNDDEIHHPLDGESIWDAIKRIDAWPTTWKLDIEVRDECGCTMVVVPVLEREVT